MSVMASRISCRNVRSRLGIETRSWGSRLELAQEQVALARAEFERATAARQDGAAKQREVDQAKVALIAAIRDETVAREESDKLVGIDESANRAPDGPL